MKNLIIYLSIIILPYTGMKVYENIGSKDINAKPSSFYFDESGLSFYRVNLICPAAPSIGCGSRAKPLLVDLESDILIAEAWLNRPGTEIAIVWEGNPDANQKSERIIELFGKNELTFAEVSDEEYSELLKSFKSGNEWYKAENVNRLSEDEALIISKRLLNFISSKTQITQDQINNLEIEFSTIIKNKITGLTSNQDSPVSKMKEIEEELLLTAGKYFNDDQLAVMKEGLLTMYIPDKDEKKLDKKCCKQNFKIKEKKNCCEKK